MSENIPDGEKPPESGNPAEAGNPAEQPETAQPTGAGSQPHGPAQPDAGQSETGSATEGAAASDAGAPVGPPPGAAQAGPPPGAAPPGPPAATPQGLPPQGPSGGYGGPPPPAGPPPGGGYGGPPPQGPPPQGAPGGYGGPPPAAGPPSQYGGPPPGGGHGGPPPPAGPPPGGGYGGQPPQGPPSAGGYGPLPPTPQATDGFGWGWNAFTANAGSLILGQLAWAAIVVVIVGLWMLILSASGVLAGSSGSDAAAGAFLGAGIAGVALILVVAVLVGIFASAGMSNATLKVVRGEQISVADFFRIPHPGTIVLVALIMAVASGILSFTFVGPLILTFFAVYIVLFVIDQGLSVGDAITAGVKMSLATPGQTVVLLLLAYLANFVGGLLCGVGTLVSLPLTALATAWLYRSQLALMHQQPR